MNRPKASIVPSSANYIWTGDKNACMLQSTSSSISWGKMQQNRTTNYP